ncbi:phage tail assembly chaperone G [Alkalihalophilus marmarensis]|uniref:phage tail assembly chaperone G n=1 Tax=Alkalihalophilus marmarensis TaxID=521377 RepID=UPI002E211323|nr:hypothetical protein [Alkalihalophilus marmarensis]
MANLKRNMIELVKDVKEGEIVTEKYLTPVFIPLTVTYEAVDLLAYIKELEKNGEEVDEKEVIFKMMDFVVKLYKGAFTKEELENGLHAPDAIPTLQDQIIFIAQGQQSNATKEFLAKKN